MRGGLKLKLMTCIDFTKSNGNPRTPDSLHFINPKAPNLYQMALFSVTEVLLSYAPDLLIPAFGFGAKLPGQFDTSHAFPLSLNHELQDANGLDVLMQMYSSCLTSVEFSSPTYFTGILENTIALAKCMR